MLMAVLFSTTPPFECPLLSLDNRESDSCYYGHGLCFQYLPNIMRKIKVKSQNVFQLQQVFPFSYFQFFFVIFYCFHVPFSSTLMKQRCSMLLKCGTCRYYLLSEIGLIWHPYCFILKVQMTHYSSQIQQCGLIFTCSGTNALYRHLFLR